MTDKLVKEEEAATPPSGLRAAWERTKKLALATWDLACEHWFLLGVGFAIGMAAAVPNLGKNNGWIHAEYTIKYGAVIVIFLLSGLSLKSKVLLQAAGRAHLHLVIQLLCLGLTPLIGYAVYRAMQTAAWLDQSLVSGLVVCTSMPTTISTNVVFTQQAGGNGAIALINAVIGNVIGIFVSPALLSLYLNQAGQAPYQKVLAQLGVTVIAPLAVGQVVQYAAPKAVAWMQAHINFGKVSNIMILLLVWNTFSGTFAADLHVGAGSLVLVIVVIVLLYGFFTLVCFGAAIAITLVPALQRWFKITRPDTVAIIMCGATKTLALGVPLISVLYGGQDNVALLALPLIVYHASQILQGNFIISPLKRWVEAEQLPIRSPDSTKSLSGPSAPPPDGSSEASDSDQPKAPQGDLPPPGLSEASKSALHEAHEELPSAGTAPGPPVEAEEGAKPGTTHGLG